MLQPPSGGLLLQVRWPLVLGGSNDERPPPYDPIALRAADNTTTSIDIVSLRPNPVNVYLFKK